MAALKLSPFPALSPSAEIETSWVAFVVPVQEAAVVQVGRQKTWRVPAGSGTVVTRLVASEVKAT